MSNIKIYDKEVNIRVRNKELRLLSTRTGLGLFDCLEALTSFNTEVVFILIDICTGVNLDEYDYMPENLSDIMETLLGELEKCVNGGKSGNDKAPTAPKKSKKTGAK